ncbi:8-amino-7-oxononanoate synthase [Shewanella psychrophila]|uniref:8-amino-7-oxononanoate synthase n=1 Tax=Shewanella psychrophila TaxID=225848 RepID=A0A1S6HMP0_9GAMM|nr:8-amino-7-oxononanoate synthase [Shewanella psychrophila]AQS36768.1 8-amino-7-oxononanoate synthase [Shewanella psychrophila]
MSTALLDKIEKTQAQLERQGLLRRRHAISASLPDEPNIELPDQLSFRLKGKHYLNFSSNDYLGLSRSKALIDAMCHASKQYGVGSGSSPLVTGYSQAHLALEQRLCKITGHEAALLFCSGFSANMALMKTLFDSSDTVMADKLMHASVIDGLRDCQVQLKRFLHNDVASAQRIMNKQVPTALITESIFSMDGDIAPLLSLSRLCKQNNVSMIVDDAHGFGVQTPPLVDAKIADIQVVTFGKALGCQGAAILASQQVVDFLVSNAREYIYSTAISPVNACVALAAVDLIDTDLSLVHRLIDNISYFRQQCEHAGIKLSDSSTAIQPLVLGDIDTTLLVADRLKELGLWVGAIRPPTVPKGSARLRMTITAMHTRDDIDRLVDGLSTTLA